MIDLRSDTVTLPSERMFDAMRKMPIGDDDRRSCETTTKLERTVADLYGKEAAMIVPSGIMANNINLMVMARMSGEAVILGSDSHIITNERAAVSAIAGIMPWVI